MHVWNFKNLKQSIQYTRILIQAHTFVSVTLLPGINSQGQLCIVSTCNFSGSHKKNKKNKTYKY